jgi:hypothetical protein
MKGVSWQLEMSGNLLALLNCCCSILLHVAYFRMMSLDVSMYLWMIGKVRKRIWCLA